METPDVYLFRRTWLARFTEHFGHDRFAEMVGKNAKHLSAIKSGSKPMGSRVARAIEQSLAIRMPRYANILIGLFDRSPDQAEFENGHLYVVDKTVRVRDDQNSYNTMALSGEEHALLASYRSADEEGRRAFDALTLLIAKHGARKRSQSTRRHN